MRSLWRRRHFDEILFWSTALIAAFLVGLDFTRMAIRW